MEQADATQDDNLELALRRIQDRAQQYFAAGWFDWHEAGVYIRNGKTFIYDPSCISWNQSTPGTDAYFQGMTANNMANIPPGGINSNLVAGISMACTLWTQRGNQHGWASQPGSTWQAGWQSTGCIPCTVDTSRFSGSGGLAP